jgi:hypothetical protein
MWGRLDGAGWLVHVLLDPQRILLLAEAAGIAERERANWFLTRLAERIPGFDATNDDARAELAFLDGADEMPPSLPQTSMLLAEAWQRRIAVAELPVVAREVVANPTLHSTTWAAEVLQLANSAEAVTRTVQTATMALQSGHWNDNQKQLRAWVDDNPPATLGHPDEDALIAKLDECEIAKETLRGEIGEPLFTRTVTKAAAVTAAASAGAQELPAVLRPAFATLRSMTLLAYRLAKFTGGWPRKVATVGAITLLVGIILAWTKQFVLGLSGLVLILAGVYLLLLIAWRRSKLVTAILRFVALGIVIAAIIVLFIPRVRDDLFASDGWVNEHVLPWLHDPSWHAPLVFAALAALVAGAIYAALRSSKKNAAT